VQPVDTAAQPSSVSTIGRTRKFMALVSAANPCFTTLKHLLIIKRLNLVNYEE